ncbi:sensor histidine kinase [Halobacteriales archaeon Cl-PHB]
MTDGLFTRWDAVADRGPVTGQELGVAYLAAVGLLLCGFSVAGLAGALTGGLDAGSAVGHATSLFLAVALLAVTGWLYAGDLAADRVLSVAMWAALGLTGPTVLVVGALVLSPAVGLGSAEVTTALGATGVVGALYGTTRAVEAERDHVALLYQRNDVLLRVLRHNIRNGMNVVRGYSSLLAEHTEGQQADWADTIAREARSVVDLADVARDVDAAVDAETDEPVDFAALVADLRQTLGEYYPEARFEVEAPERAVARADGTVEVAVWHLFEFAIHRSEGTPVTVTVTADDDAIELTVADEGEPLSEDLLTVLETGTERPLEHLDGMDLWAVRWLVETVGGSVEVARNDPRGTEVTLTFDAAGQTTSQGARTHVGRR